MQALSSNVPALLAAAPPRSRRPSAVPMATRGGGRDLVDEGLLWLRVRIRELERVERHYAPPAGWMEWEKWYYANGKYDADVTEAVGLLQRFLLESRPSVAASLVAVLAVSLLMTGVVAATQVAAIPAAVLRFLLVTK